MSKVQDAQNEQKAQKNSIASMSSRQQILYLMNKTQNSTQWEDNQEDATEEVIDHHQYYLQKKEKLVNIIVILEE